MTIVRIDHREALAALRATGSSDADILYARKEELLVDTHRLRMLGIVPIIFGCAICLTIIGAIIGIPAIRFGIDARKRIRANIQTAESAYTDYLASLTPRTKQTNNT